MSCNSTHHKWVIYPFAVLDERVGSHEPQHRTVILKSVATKDLRFLSDFSPPAIRLSACQARYPHHSPQATEN